MAKNLGMALSALKAPAMVGKSKDIATTKPATGKKSIVKIVSRKK